jgi:hypothetical protein
MKLFNKCAVMLFACLIFATTGCKDYLNENSISNVTSDSYYTTEQGFEDLVRSSYPILRGIIQQRELVLLGTDMFTVPEWDGGGAGNPLNTYDARLNSSEGNVSNLWNTLYIEIGRANTAISRATAVKGMDKDLLDVRVGEAKFLRAFCYFYLVQQWGDVPMPLSETLTPSKKVTKVPAKDVYVQIIKDLLGAAAVLPAKATDYGRATKGAAQFLLARVYLTRGWNFNNSLGGTSADFQSALKYADSIIANYPLAKNYSDLFPQHNQNPLLQGNPTQNDQNPEIVFAVQYSDNSLTNSNPYGNAEPGNDAHSVFGGQVETIPGNLGRTSDYNRFLEHFVVTPATYRLFDPNIDTRYQWDFVGAEYALKDVPNFHPVKGNDNVTINIKKGDTVILFRPWDNPADQSEKGMDVGGTKHYGVYNVAEFGRKDQPPTNFNALPGMHPLMFKFWQPHIEYGDAYGTLDQPIFRSAEAYLIAAEAILKGATGGKLGGADVYYNKIVDRALGSNAGKNPYCAETPGQLTSLDSVSYRATPGNLTIDMILDERARELLGESVRWYDLKRTGKLIERAKAMNPWTEVAGDINKHHLLRPIPQSQIDLSSTIVGQNPGY